MSVQMSLLAGRFFRDADNARAQKVAIVNQSFASKFYGGSNPVGRYLDKDTVIVGEVSDVAISSGLNPTAPLMNEQIMYTPAAQVDGYTPKTDTEIPMPERIEQADAFFAGIGA